MTYLIFGLGALLSIGGALAIYFGYDIIQVERGWSSVIAGAAALSGGIVTLALAAVLRSLNRLRASLLAATSQPNATAREPAEAAPVIANPAALPETSGIRPSPLPFDLGAPAAPAPIDLPGLAARPQRVAPAEMPFESRAEDSDIASRPSEVVPTPGTADSVETMPLVEAAPEHEAAANPSIMAMGHWIERALAGIEEVEPAKHPASNESVPDLGAALPEPQLEEHAATSDAMTEPSLPHDEAPPHPEAAIAAIELSGSESGTHDAPEALHPAPSPAIIGHYESDGTVYVMFADGSIEARSESGVYRFGSMAELKAFVETGN